VSARRRPRWSEFRPFLQTRPIRWWTLERRLAAAATIADLRGIARRHTPRAAFDYTDGAADNETGLRRARDAYDRVEFAPGVLRDVSHLDSSTEILGRPSALPLVFAPTGFTRLMAGGERGAQRAAAILGQEFRRTMQLLGATDIAQLTSDKVRLRPG
jgi:L-lactate dehydrogenase (cytochrome)